MRLFGITGDLYHYDSLSSSILSSVFGDTTGSEKQEIQSALEDNEDSSYSLPSEGPKVNRLICSLCLGILQFVYRDDKEFVVRKDGADNFASSIVQLVKQNDHQIDGFSLEVSIPPTIQENERSMW